MHREKIRQNRLRWIEYLEAPEREKAIGTLEQYEYPEARCCLGHACVAFSLQRVVNDLAEQIYYEGEFSFAPPSLIDLLGFWNSHGGTFLKRHPIDMTPFIKVSDDVQSIIQWRSLAEVNDETPATPQQIAAYLRTVIDGGVHTPFRPLTEYPEAGAVLSAEPHIL